MTMEKPKIAHSNEGPIALADIKLDTLCTRILARHREKIQTRKDRLAVPNLAKIITATLKLSNERGFHAMTLRALAQETGLSMGGLYSYFDTKDTLLLMILDEVISTTKDVLNSAPQEIVDDPAQHLRWLIVTHVELTERMRHWFAFSYLEAKAFPSAAKKAAIEYEAAIEDVFAIVLKRGVKAGRFSTTTPEFTATLIKPLLQDWYVKRSKYRRRSISAADYANRVANFVESAIGVKS